MRLLAALAVFLAVLCPIWAQADDWVAVKLRGQVLQMMDGDWQPLRRGDVVPDDRLIRTTLSGRVSFVRDKESISLGANTQISIHDKVGQKFTHVTQFFGQVEIEAEVRNVKHFEVDTPFLAAVVKGTRFVVTSGRGGASVQVNRGLVSVEAAQTHVHAEIPAGQTAKVSSGGDFKVAWPGSDNTVVLGANNLPLAGASALAPSNSGGSVPPGQNPNFVPPGQDPDFVPPGQDPDFVPPGQNPDFVPPGQNPDIALPDVVPNISIPVPRINVPGGPN